MTVLPTDLIPLPTMPYSERPAELPLDVEECRTALWRAAGNISRAAELLKIPSIRLRNFVKNSPYLSAEWQESRERVVDMAEDVVVEALMDTADTGRQDSMARFVLSGQGKSRGHGAASPGVNINAPGGGKIVISWEDGATISGEPSEGNVIEHEASAHG